MGLEWDYATYVRLGTAEYNWDHDLVSGYGWVLLNKSCTLGRDANAVTLTCS